MFVCCVSLIVVMYKPIKFQSTISNVCVSQPVWFKMCVFNIIFMVCMKDCRIHVGVYSLYVYGDVDLISVHMWRIGIGWRVMVKAEVANFSHNIFTVTVFVYGPYDILSSIFIVS